VLVLPNVGAMSDAQCAAVRRFVERGGSLIATGASTLYNEWGDRRADFALADLFRAHAWEGSPEKKWAGDFAHTYLRISPELRARVWGPKTKDEPAAAGERHPVLRGFEETDILPFGGQLERVRVDAGAVVPLTFVPPFPTHPPETAWMRTPKTDIAGLVLSTHAAGGRVAYMPADLDRRFARENLPDHGDLLANMVRWAAGERIPLAVEGRGLVDCHLYAQPGRLVLHVVNLTSAGTWRAPVDELIPVGPIKVRVRLPEGVRGKSVRLLVNGGAPSAAVAGGWCAFELKQVLDHEVAVIA
jgi:hypothetical protein